MKVFASSSARETQQFAGKIAREIGATPQKESQGALVIGLRGALGSGKTTFVQGFAKGLGIKEKILSPTFVIIKSYKIPASRQGGQDTKYQIQKLYHIDCYRVGDAHDILGLGWEDIISNPRHIVLVEWPELIQNILPKESLLLEFRAKGEHGRVISFER